MQNKAFISDTSAEYIDQVYEQFLRDPQSLHPSWHWFFQGVEFIRRQGGAKAGADGNPYDLRIGQLITAFRRRGHLAADLDPLGSKNGGSQELELEFHGFSEAELDAEFPTRGILPQPAAPLRQILEVLNNIYCATIGVEYMDLQSAEVETWFQNRIEPCLNKPVLNLDDKRFIMEMLAQAELFEEFLHTKFVGQKRFSLEGAEVLIPALENAIETGADLGITDVVIGMPHRGRLNVLANILGKSYQEIFSEFDGRMLFPTLEGSGDVKYHKGFGSRIVTRNGKEVIVSLVANPSHLEAVNPVVLGKARAKQVRKGDDERRKIMPILIHGDAAFAGQGVVYECMQMSKLHGYSIGGTLHIVVNNQIGFTTTPEEGRSSLYCTDVSKIAGCPVLHVNGDDPEAVFHCIRIAMEFRDQFQNDVIVDIVCYRRHGHNEGDEPSYTSPIDYRAIRERSSVRENYRDQLIRQGELEKEIALQIEQKFQDSLKDALDETRKMEPAKAKGNVVFDGAWSKYRSVEEKDLFAPIDTSIPTQELKIIIEKITSIPKDFHIHPQLKRVIQRRAEVLEDPSALLDWAMGEHLAFGTLLWDGWHVRLSGQDSERGTFSHRHAVWVDNETERKYNPLREMKEDQGRFDIFNSPLSEYGVLGFEYGYSLNYPDGLVLWEAQFGDFANGAQIIIDQFFCSSEQKWARFSGLVMLLPHGQEGQGPEHSSARIERFLSNAAQNNIQVAMPTTPAQLFHLLRRQVLREWRRPLVVATPKGFLRNPMATSHLEDFSKGGFQEVLKDPNPVAKPKKLVFCTGKVYYDIIKEMETREYTKDFNIHRLEQIYPFDRDSISKIIDEHPEKKVIWIQEEPLNQGAAIFVRGRFLELLKGDRPDQMYIALGRSEAASPATGYLKQFEREHRQLMDELFHHIQEL